MLLHRAAGSVRTTPITHSLQAVTAGLVGLAMLFAGTWNLCCRPALLWDEGWTLAVARNWVQFGHYGQMRDGLPRSAGLSAALPVVAPAALSFKIFGVGAWQGRLPDLLFTIAALWLVYRLARELYDRKVAFGTLGVLLLLPAVPQLHPLLVGRQVLGEMPLLFYLLAGYLCLFLALCRNAWLILPAVVLWGIALKTKAQAPPFWFASLALPLAISLIKGWRRPALLLALGFIGGWLVAHQILSPLESWIVGSLPLPADPIQGIYDVTALVTAAPLRVFALGAALTVGLPALVGLAHSLWQLNLHLFRPARPPLPVRPEQVVVRLALLGLAGSWMAWYVLMAMVWLRYLFPAVFVGGIFTAAWLSDLTCHFDLKFTSSRPARSF